MAKHKLEDWVSANQLAEFIDDRVLKKTGKRKPDISEVRKAKLVKELRKFMTKHKLSPHHLSDLAIEVQVDVQVEADAAYEKKYGFAALMRREEQRTDAILGRLAGLHGVPYRRKRTFKKKGLLPKKIS